MTPKIFRCRGNVFTELLPSNDRRIYRHTQRHTSNDTAIVACIHCRGNVFSEPMPYEYKSRALPLEQPVRCQLICIVTCISDYRRGSAW
jgi:hypothetical protein